MRKVVLILMLLVVFLGNVKSQNSDKNNAIGLQIGLSRGGQMMVGNIYNFLSSNPYTADNPPSISMSWDYALGDRISVGGTFSYNKSSFEVGNSLTSGITPASWKGTAFGVGARPLYHFLGKTSKKFDFYGGIGLHLLVWSYDYSPDDSKNLTYSALATKANFMFPITLGLRYYVNNKIGISGEAGTNGISLLNLGLNYRFDAL
ncbi:MAG: outer membrane beta-barrel protein [Bacteroidia bacterium]